MVNQFYYEIEYTIKIEEAGQRGSRGLWPPSGPLWICFAHPQIQNKIESQFPIAD
jgi:hypothetical protein